MYLSTTQPGPGCMHALTADNNRQPHCDFVGRYNSCNVQYLYFIGKTSIYRVQPDLSVCQSVSLHVILSVCLSVCLCIPIIYLCICSDCFETPRINKNGGPLSAWCTIGTWKFATCNDLTRMCIMCLDISTLKSRCWLQLPWFSTVRLLRRPM